MGWLELIGAGIVLLVTLRVGMVAHELTHAIVLKTIGVPYDVEWRSHGTEDGVFGVDVYRAWASVTPRSVPTGVSPWGFRLAAIAPFVLATPGVLILVGVLPDPVAAGNTYLTAATLGWFGFALPSPQDFSWFWHADSLVGDLPQTPSTDNE